jgi:hypothetical protein
MNQVAAAPKWMKWVGWAMTAVPALMMGGMGTVMGVLQPKEAVEGFEKYGYDANLFRVLIGVEVASVVIYLVPQTSVLGAILLTGYLGGAVATHVAAGEAQWFVPIVVGVLVWGGLFLRDARIRALIPFRK